MSSITFARLQNWVFGVVGVLVLLRVLVTFLALFLPALRPFGIVTFRDVILHGLYVFIVLPKYIAEAIHGLVDRRRSRRQEVSDAE